MYPTSLPQIFVGDHVELAKNDKWQKLASENGEDKILFADNGFKINRANGKVSMMRSVVMFAREIWRKKADSVFVLPLHEKEFFLFNSPNTKTFRTLCCQLQHV